jgi:hypothetical protein
VLGVRLFPGYTVGMLERDRFHQLRNRYRGDPYPGQMLGTLRFAYRVIAVDGPIVTLKVISAPSKRLGPKAIGRTVRISLNTLRRPAPFISNMAWHVPPTCFRDAPLPDWSTGPR